MVRQALEARDRVSAARTGSGTLNARIVQLSTVALTRTAAKLRQGRIDRQGETQALTTYRDYEWQRMSYVHRLLPKSGSLLEVGPGRGYLSRMMAKTGAFEPQVALDIVDTPNPAKKYGKTVEYRRMSVADLDYADDSFDTVICMEVLEHLETHVMLEGLRQIRRVCRGRLIMSVPFLEALPLPSYHKQRFDAERVVETFPNGRYTLMLKEPVSRTPWILIEEKF